MKLSKEHSGFIFENDPHESIEKLQQHSGGSGSKALQMSMENYATDMANPNAPIEDWEIDISRGKYDANYEDNSLDLNLTPPPEKKSIWSCFF